MNRRTGGRSFNSNGYLFHAADPLDIFRRLAGFPGVWNALSHLGG